MIGRVGKERKNVRLWKGDMHKPGESGEEAGTRETETERQSIGRGVGKM